MRNWDLLSIMSRRRWRGVSAQSAMAPTPTTGILEARTRIVSKVVGTGMVSKVVGIGMVNKAGIGTSSKAVTGIKVKVKVKEWVGSSTVGRVPALVPVAQAGTTTIPKVLLLAEGVRVTRVRLEVEQTDTEQLIYVNIVYRAMKPYKHVNVYH